MPPPLPPRLCAAHPSNHLMVQELFLHAALGGQYLTSGERKRYLTLAKHISKLPTPCGPALVAGVLPRHWPLSAPWRHTPAHSIVYGRACQQMRQQQEEQEHQRLQQEGPEQIHGSNRVEVYYDDARTHEKRLGDLLSLHNFEVALIGKLRCGCPVAPRAHFLLTNDLCKNLSLTIHEKNERFEEQDAELLFARAVKGLEACGYLKAVQKKRVWECEMRKTRYVCTTKQPSFAPDPYTFHNNNSLQELLLSWAPSWCFHVRRLFLTGPNPFVRHLMLVAHKNGYELAQNGMYRPSQGIRELVLLSSEEDIFTRLEMPYVNPFHRYAYCRLHNLM